MLRGPETPGYREKRNAMTTEQDWKEASRSDFEEEIYREYFLRSIHKPEPGGSFLRTDAVTKAELCKRDGDSYERPEVFAMWFGWCMHQKYQHQAKYPGLSEAGVVGFVVDSGRDIPKTPVSGDIPEEVYTGTRREPQAWLDGAKAWHEKWLKSLGVTK